MQSNDTQAVGDVGTVLAGTLFGGADTFQAFLNLGNATVIGDVHTAGGGAGSDPFVVGGNDTMTMTGASAGISHLLIGDVLNNHATLIGGDDTILATEFVSVVSTVIGDVQNNFTGSVFGGADTLTGNSSGNVIGDVQTNSNAVTGGNDRIFGTISHDFLVGDVEINATQGVVTGGDDHITGGDGNDTIIGDVWTNNGYLVRGGDDELHGGSGDDEIIGDAASGPGKVIAGGADQLYGDGGNDTLRGGQGNDSLFGGDGNDILDGEDGADVMDGGAGNDLLFVDDANDVVVEAMGGGSFDRVAANVDYVLSAGAEVEALTTTSFGSNWMINLTGNQLAQTITGNAGANILHTGGGAADTLRGSLGNDTYHVFNASDVIIEGAGEGSFDRVTAAVSFTLAADDHIELFTTDSPAGTTNIDLTGNGFAQTIEGNSGDNVLSDGGGSGADLLNGYFGNDTYIVRNAGTTIDEVAGRGTNDRVAAAVDFALAADDDIELLTTTSTAGTAGIDLVGNALAQTIVGNAGSNILRSGTGAPDILRGLAGNDVYRVFNSGDAIVEMAGEGTDDRLITTVSYNLATGVDVERMQTDATGGTSNINLIGNELGQTIIGNAGENYIRGQKGSDVLYGLLGDDQFAYFASDFEAGVNDVIKDFHEVAGDTDLLRLQGSAADYTFADVGANLQITRNASGGSLTINNFSVVQLDAAQVSYFS